MQNTHNLIKTEAQLRRLIPAYPKLLDKRIQPGLDSLSIEFIRLSKLAIVYIQQPDSTSPDSFPTEAPSFVFITPQQWNISNTQQLEITATDGALSLLFLIPGVDHLLRLNGETAATTTTAKTATTTTIEKVQHKTCHLNIDQVYFHCGRAAMRSQLWQNNRIEDTAVNNIKSFCQQARYALLATSTSAQQPLLSPRGEPQGMFHLIDDKTLILPDRPGNKIAASLCNILNNSLVKLILVIPGSHKVLQIEGSAQLTTDAEILEKTETNNKPARLAIKIDISQHEIYEEPALRSADIWNPKRQNTRNDLTSFSKALSSHINGDGLIGKMTHVVIDQVVKKDSKNLY